MIIAMTSYKVRFCHDWSTLALNTLGHWHWLTGTSNKFCKLETICIRHHQTVSFYGAPGILTQFIISLLTTNCTLLYSQQTTEELKIILKKTQNNMQRQSKYLEKYIFCFLIPFHDSFVVLLRKNALCTSVCSCLSSLLTDFYGFGCGCGVPLAAVTTGIVKLN